VSKLRPVVVVGAGIGGLAAALDLAVAGFQVTVIERQSVPGGKIRALNVGGHMMDAGPTVFTMRWVFESLFANAGAHFADAVRLRVPQVLARHAWDSDARFDLFSDVERSVEAISEFSGPAEGRRYRSFSEDAKNTYETLEKSFILAAAPTPVSLALSAGIRGLSGLWRTSPFATMWEDLGGYFHDPRLRQLFGRYATYCGSSPFECPATLSLVAHVERSGVWLVDGGMQRLAQALADLASQRGVEFLYGTNVHSICVRNGRATGVTLSAGEQLEAEAVVVNADASAVAQGLLGREAARAIYLEAGQRSLSAVTWCALAQADGFRLSRHNVFFSRDYRAEFDNIFGRSRLPNEPTVYVCAQDRDDADHDGEGPERLLVLVNAPATGDTHKFDEEEIRQCKSRALGVLRRCGLSLELGTHNSQVTTPNDFAQLFPGTGGALYGQATHGWRASFTRPTARTSLASLYLAGGSVHPGPGVPMATLSGRLAAAQLIEDLRSTGV